MNKCIKISFIKMKLLVVLVAISAVALGSVLPSRNTYGLKEDIEDFLALLPKAEIAGIVLDYLANDAEVQGAYEFIFSDEFKGLLYDIEGIKEYQEFLKNLQNNGLNVYYYLDQLHKILGMKPFEPVPSRKSTRKGTGVRGMLDEIESILPYDKIKALFYEKLETSTAFRNLIDVMKGDEFKSIIEQLRANPGFQAVVDRLKEQGVDIQAIIDFVNRIFGWNIEPKKYFM